MTDKFIYIILLLLLVIFVSQSISVILAIPILREGYECLPNCEDVSYNELTGEIPKCKGVKIGVLSVKDAKTLCVPKVDTFTTNINKYLDNQYNFTSLIKPLYNTNIKLQSVSFNSSSSNNENTGSLDNIQQMAINKYFTDFSGITPYVTNQDILDNMANDTEFNKIIDEFNYSLDQKTPTTTTKQNIKTIITNYSNDRTTPPVELSKNYKEILNDISGIINDIDRRCDSNNPDYLEENLKQINNNEITNTKYYGKESSFHIIANYINDAIAEKLTTT
jgi:hypothetical protein